MQVCRYIWIRTALLVAAVSCFTIPASAQLTGTLDPVYDGVGVDQKLGAALPADIPFYNERGEEVTLGSYFQGDTPVILTLVYHNCPMLCNVLMDGFMEGLKAMDWAPGEQFEIVTISIAPDESYQLASQKKAAYVQELGKEPAVHGWHFLTGSESSIDAVAEAVGFNYKWLDEIEQFVHPAILTILTPEGKVARYLQGLNFEPRDIRLALVEASNGSIGNPIDLVALYCLQYDPDSNSYVAHASNLMRLGGFLTVISLSTMLFVFWRRESNRSNHIANT